MTTWQQIEAKEKLIEEYVEQYNEIHRQAKKLKQKVIQPMQVELKNLYKQWKAEIKNKGDGKETKQ